MGRRPEAAWKGTVGLIAARERGDVDIQFRNRLMVTKSCIDRLGLEKELHGHVGCVNCLEWNHDGSILASASDDLHVILWDPYRYKQLHNIVTGHTGNIFSVKFLSPGTFATCAADGTVRVRTTDGAAAAAAAAGSSLLECSCHCGRVKRLATAPGNHHMLWSAAEDGLVLQHDLRAPHRCNSDSANVLVDLLAHLGRHAEAKCLAINPRRPYQLAVGANDFYVRLYDMRMCSLARLQHVSVGETGPRVQWERQSARAARAGHGDPDNHIPKAAVQYYAPGHLSMEPNENTFPKKATTYIAFSDDGNEILVNLGSEQVYLFDINSARRPVLVESFIIEHNHGNRDNEAKIQLRNGTNGTLPPQSPTTAAAAAAAAAAAFPLPDHVRRLKEMANECVNRGAYCDAVELYNESIGECPDCAILYSNRAAALMRRGWSGDTYAAIKDCYSAIRLDSTHVKSHFRLAKGLMDLKRAREAHECLLYFKDRFPRHANSHAVFLLQKDINLALENLETQPDEAPGEAEENQSTSVMERQLRAAALDYSRRYLGHCNTTTDIKEANFLGSRADYLAAGSDDGSLFIWSRRAGNIVRVLRGDESIVNCIQMHPSACLLATSGIEAAVRLWSPRPEDGSEESRVVPNARSAAAANQQRMRCDPFEAMLLSISIGQGGQGGHHDPHAPACRAS